MNTRLYGGLCIKDLAAFSRIGHFVPTQIIYLNYLSEAGRDQHPLWLKITDPLPIRKLVATSS